MDTDQIHLVDRPSAEDLEFLEQQLYAYNMDQVGAYDGRRLAAFLRDESGKIVAGIAGHTWAGQCKIDVLWVQRELRGQHVGSRLLAAAEVEARARGCSVVVLSSFSFQAPEFYRRHGYQVAGSVADCPPGHTDVYLFKRLVEPGAAPGP